MNKKPPDRTVQQLMSELEDLRIRLLEAEETLEAIRAGSVDAIIVSGTEGEKVFTLASAETPYRIILEEINLGAATLSSEGVVLYCNHSFGELLSVPLERIIGSKCVSFLPSAVKPVFKALLKEGLTGKASGDIYLKTLNNRGLHLNLYFKRLPDAIDGDICLIITDITGRKNYQEHLENEVKKATGIIELKNKELRGELAKLEIEKEKVQEGEQRWATTLSSIGDAVIATDTSGNITFLNPVAEELTGWKYNKALHQPLKKVFRIINEFSRKEVENPFEKIIRTGMISGLANHTILISKDNREIPIDDSGAPIKNKNGDIIGIVLIFRDISERRKAEESLRKTKQKLDIALENANIGLWEWDLTTDKVFWDVRTEKMLGFKPGTYDPVFSTFESCVHEEDLPNLKESLRLALNSGKPYEPVFRTRPVDGNYNYISAKGIVSRDDSGKPLNISGVCFDITSMKKGSEQALFRINEELLRSNKDLQEFAYVASHDLQEPLRMVSSFTQLLEQKYYDIVDEDGRDYIKFAVEGSKRMYDLLNALLKYSRVETKGKTFARVDMNEVLKKVTSNLSLRISEKKALVSIAKLPVVLADESQMIQLFQNLIENSIKFSKEVPKIKISARSQNDHYLFSVKDEGIGIESLYFEKIFKIFQRLNPKEEYEGTGIGLSISRRIIERHGGKIWLESEPEKGTTFFFTIPKG